MSYRPTTLGDSDDTPESERPATTATPAGRSAVYECTRCESVALAFERSEVSMTCHGEPMRRVTDCEMQIEQPDLREVLLEVFGLPKTGLDICLCVIGEGPLTANEVAGSLGYDRSTVTRYLKRLVDLGLLRRSQLNREGGGVVNVYHSVDLEQMRRETLIGFLVWAGEAAARIDEANQRKQEYLAANTDRILPEVFWESTREE